MTMVDISGGEGIKEGDEVIVFGSEPSVTEVAEWAGTISYEFLTGISGRVRRLYLQE
jgi:alanine racemase